MLNKLCKSVAAAALVSFASLGTAHAADEFFIADSAKNIAINGYDAVAYHTVGAPTKGSADFKYEHDGVVWKFASAANMEAFQADPAGFVPAYGGWCTVGTSKGKKLPTRPELFDIVDGQLYLNSSEGAHQAYLEDKSGTIAAADTNWVDIESTPAAEL